MSPIIPLAGIMCSTAVVIVSIVARTFSRRRDLTRSSSDDETTRRLERIEQIVETTAIEVERLAESNRFVAKLLADKANALPRSIEHGPIDT